MNVSVIWAVTVFAVVGSFSPGPNTMIATSIGQRSGWRAAWPHALGVSVGFGSMLVLAASGTIAARWLSPELAGMLQWPAAAYLCWCAWSIATSAVGSPGKVSQQHFSFAQSFGFQYVNPKAWMLAASATTAFPQATQGVMALVALLVWAAVAIASILFWAALGAELNRVLRTPRRERTFNISMGLALAGSAVWMLMAGI